MSSPPSPLNARVVAALVIQLVGYAALLALLSPETSTAVVGALAGAPPVVLIPLAVPAAPAALLAFAVGAVLGAVGLSPASAPAVLFAPGDVVFLVCAYVVGVVAQLLDDPASA